MKTYNNGAGFQVIECKGCDELHYIKVDGKLPNGHGPWGFNKNQDSPTFTPSVNIHWAAIPDLNKPERRCHFVITDGKIQYCGDCTHSLKGQTIELPDITPE